MESVCEGCGWLLQQNKETRVKMSKKEWSFPAEKNLNMHPTE